MGDLLYKEETHQLRGLIYQVRNELKAGWPEAVYHQALVQVLQNAQIPVVSKKRRALFHRNVEIHVFEPDLVVWDLIVLELKVLPYASEFSGNHFAQIMHYLKFFNRKLGLLVNFAPNRVKIKRVIWKEAEVDVFENYEHFQGKMTNPERDIIQQLRLIILDLAKQFGLGYPENVYRKIITIELEYQGHTCQPETAVPIKWHNETLATYQSNFLLANECCLLSVKALSTKPTAYDFSQMQTYLTNIGLKFGLIVNFGFKQLQIFGVNSTTSKNPRFLLSESYKQKKAAHE